MGMFTFGAVLMSDRVRNSDEFGVVSSRRVLQTRAWQRDSILPRLITRAADQNHGGILKTLHIVFLWLPVARRDVVRSNLVHFEVVTSE